MLWHEGLEETASLFRIFCNILLQLGYRQSGRISHCVGGRARSAQSEPFDVTVKFLRQTERGFQSRVHEIMLFDGNKNGSETHDDLPLGFVARRACSHGYVAVGPTGPSSCCPEAFSGMSSVAFDLS